MSQEIFLIDSNSLMTPHLTFYPFDMAHSFWDQMEQHIANGNIAILDMVKDEILKGTDELSSWMKTISIMEYIDHRDQAIVKYYGTILSHIQFNKCYKEAALTEWARDTVADAWLISAAILKGYTIITFETANNGLNTRSPSKNAKIPDIAATFGVKTANLYYMMRTLGFKL